MKGINQTPSDTSFFYAGVAEILLYLTRHTQPDVVYAVKSCAMHFCSKKYNEVTLKRIGRYLKLTWYKGMNLKPPKHLKIVAYYNADFAGLYGYEDITECT